MRCGDFIMNSIDRRSFLNYAARAGVAAAGANAFFTTTRTVAENAPPSGDSYCAFTESFQSWPIPKVCAKFREIGLDGLDLTVRPGGHIQPENAAKELPGAVQAAKDDGVRISMLSTAINDADATAESILASCAELGIDRVKLGYYSYSEFGKLLEQIGGVQTKLERVVELAKKYNVLPCVHIHSGPTIPSGGALAYLLIREFKPDEIGAYVDPMHMTIEGGNDGWRQGLDLLAPWIAISSFKNCIWTNTGRDKFGQERWRSIKCPVADGIAPIPDYVAALRKLDYHGLFTLHSEYCDSNSWKNLSTDECLEQTKRDLIYVKSLLKA
jgi:sugar phosphate isomerase/epimerase